MARDENSGSCDKETDGNQECSSRSETTEERHPCREWSQRHQDGYKDFNHSDPVRYYLLAHHGVHPSHQGAVINERSYSFRFCRGEFLNPD